MGVKPEDIPLSKRVRRILRSRVVPRCFCPCNLEFFLGVFMQKVRNLRFSNPTQLLKKFHIQRVDDPILFAKQLGFSVSSFDSFNPMLHSFRDFGTLRAGLYQERKIFHMGGKIYISEDCSLPTRKFYIAYLIANYELYSKPSEKYTCILFDKDLFDRRAYQYAVDLLIPDDISHEPITSECLTRLSGEYQVSKHLIEYKINHKEKIKKFEVKK